jgi:hypothetical protein
VAGGSWGQHPLLRARAVIRRLCSSVLPCQIGQCNPPIPTTFSLSLSVSLTLSLYRSHSLTLLGILEQHTTRTQDRINTLTPLSIFQLHAADSQDDSVVVDGRALGQVTADQLSSPSLSLSPSLPLSSPPPPLPPTPPPTQHAPLSFSLVFGSVLVPHTQHRRRYRGTRR